MDVLKRMNDAIDYIEQNLEKKVNYKEVANIAQFSDHHLGECFHLLQVFRLQNIFVEDV